MTTNPSALDAVMVRERPILFSAPMVRALLEGTKTQTRRVLKTQPVGVPHYGQASLTRSMTKPVFYAAWDERAADGSTMCVCPYGVPGDRLWVRETFRIGEDLGAGWEPWMSTGDRFVICDAEPSSETYCVPEVYEVPRNAREVNNSEGTDEHWRSFGPIPSIFMPRWASRITLEITGVRVERVQAISEADASAEGVEAWAVGAMSPEGQRIYSPTGKFERLWSSINGNESWHSDPWVWVVSFQRITP